MWVAQIKQTRVLLYLFSVYSLGITHSYISLATLLCVSCVSPLVIAFPHCALPFDVVRDVRLCRAVGRVATQHPAVCCNFVSLLRHYASSLALVDGSRKETGIRKRSKTLRADVGSCRSCSPGEAKVLVSADGARLRLCAGGLQKLAKPTHVRIYHVYLRRRKNGSRR